MAEMETRILKWFVITAFGMTTVMGTVVVAVSRLIH